MCRYMLKILKIVDMYMYKIIDESPTMPSESSNFCEPASLKKKKSLPYLLDSEHS